MMQPSEPIIIRRAASIPGSTNVAARSKTVRWVNSRCTRLGSRRI